MTTVQFKVGDPVIVKQKVKEPRLYLDIGGWQGRIDAVLTAEEASLVAVSWDSVTLKNMPEGLIRWMADHGLNWYQAVLEAGQLKRVEARDAAEDAARTIEEFLRRYGMGEDEEHPDEGSDALVKGASGATGRPIAQHSAVGITNPFDVENFLSALAVPQAEQQAVCDALTRGVARYYQREKELKYGEQPYFLLPTHLRTPHIFGYSGLTVLEDGNVSPQTKLRIAYFTCQTTDPFSQGGIPYGLMEILSYMAAQNALSPDLFRSVLLALELAGEVDWLKDLGTADGMKLSDWLINHPGIAADEKLWWLWHISTYIDRKALGRKLVPYWLHHQGLAQELRLKLGWAWLLNEERVGTPPAPWRLMEATFAGDLAGAEAATLEISADAESMPASGEELLPLQLPAPLLNQSFVEEDPFVFLRIMMMVRFGRSAVVPAHIRRAAIGNLIRLGQDPVEVGRAALEINNTVRHITVRNALNQGVIDLIEEFGDQMSPDQISRLIDQAIGVAPAKSRLAFYQLGAKLYGERYVKEAMKDSAGSIRAWAAAWGS